MIPGPCVWRTPLFRLSLYQDPDPQKTFDPRSRSSFRPSNTCIPLPDPEVQSPRATPGVDSLLK